jgi:hypothetical protein
MFGILVGTLNKAKIEDKERSASEAVGAHDHMKKLLAERCSRQKSVN